MRIRAATIQDIQQIQEVRNAVTENRLSDPNLVTDEDCEVYITIRGKGWVCEVDHQIAGFAIADLKAHNIWALFLRPEFEGRGIGRKLHDTMLNWYFKQTKNNLWLGTAPDTRAEIFYRNAGWKAIGTHGKQEIKFQMTFDDWTNNKKD